MKLTIEQKLKLAESLLLRISKCKLEEQGYWCNYDISEELMSEARDYVKLHVNKPQPPKSVTVDLITNKKGETILPIPKEFVKYLNLKVNDVMHYTVKDGKMFLSKKK